jgi:hypothetical protein
MLQAAPPCSPSHSRVAAAFCAPVTHQASALFEEMLDPDRELPVIWSGGSSFRRTWKNCKLNASLL